LIVPFTTLALWLAGAKMSDSIQETLFLGVGITVLAVVALRLVAASYFVWKDDQVQKSQLKAEIEAPERAAEIDMKKFTLDLRKRLSERLGRLAALATLPPTMLGPNKLEFKELYQTMADVDEIINQLSYDTSLRIASIQLRNACASLLAEEKEPDSGFYEQRKVTFRIIHKEDLVSSLLSLMELEIVLEEQGITTLNEGPEGDLVRELKDLLTRLGDRYYSEEVREELKAAVRGRTKLKA
jgi:hypothetical protein